MRKKKERKNEIKSLLATVYVRLLTLVLKSRLVRAFTITLVICTPASSYAVTTINVYNELAVSVGDTRFLQASTLATQLSFSQVQLLADNDINIIDNVDFSAGLFGTTSNSMTFNAPTVNLNNFNLTMGDGNLLIVGANFNFSNSILDSTLKLLSGSAMSLTNSVITGDLFVNTGSTVQISGGQFGANIFVGDNASTEFIGSGFELDTGSGFLPVGAGILMDSSGLLRGTLASGDTFEVDFIQNAATSSIILTTVPVPAAVWLFGSGLFGLIGLARRSKL